MEIPEGMKDKLQAEISQLKEDANLLDGLTKFSSDVEILQQHQEPIKKKIAQDIAVLLQAIKKGDSA